MLTAIVIGKKQIYLAKSLEPMSKNLTCHQMSVYYTDVVKFMILMLWGVKHVPNKTKKRTHAAVTEALHSVVINTDEKTNCSSVWLFYAVTVLCAGVVPKGSDRCRMAMSAGRRQARSTIWPLCILGQWIPAQQ